MKRMILPLLLAHAALPAHTQVPTTIAQRSTITAADSIALMRRTFKKPNETVLAQARSRLVNPQWSYTLPPGRGGTTGSAFVFAKNRPTVVVLIHGITGYPSTDARIGTLKGARNYWGYDFVWGLFGAQTDRPTTFADDNPASALGRPDWETRFLNDNNSAHHFVTIYGKPKPDRNFYTPFSLMMTYRDGSEPMKKQVAQTAAQIVSLYDAQFGSWPAEKQPQLILLGHSFGGLVARTICSAPDGIPSNMPDVAAENFSAADKANMEFIRNRTLHITTLATPHEGSPITWNAAMGSVVQHLPGPGVQINETDPDTYVIRQLRTGFVRNLNATVLRPELCRRSDASLIPVHALGGRVPAGPDFFQNPNVYDNDLNTVDGGIGRANIDDLLPGETNRKQFECYNLVRVDYAMHLFFGGNLLKPWGAAPDDNKALDIIRVRDVQPVTGCLTLPIYNLASFLAKPRLYYLRTDWDAVPHKSMALPGTCSGRFTEERGTVSDGEIDNDGFVPINSALGVKLGTDNKNYFDHAGGGSWYRFYRSGADFHNHGTIKFNEDVGKWLRENIIGNAVVPLVALQALGNTAAGPKVARSGERSSW
ncbi:hypothetical protein [Flaviaesturariibacter amylovorans]|uniref:GPI inositol-deacylase PGAP1-like alpha/beta domain-containing protein n=1 Tax=Flaviaesturariibacter amylovorans TaxID=1084520 RepID=A0ABP8HGF6_9BACT